MNISYHKRLAKKRVRACALLFSSLVITILFFCTPASAAYQIAGQCYQGPENQAAAFKNQFPVIDSGNILAVSGVTASNGTLTYDVIANNLSTGTINTYPSRTLDMQPCVIGLVKTGNVQLMLVTLATVFCFVFGWRIGANISNIGGSIT